MTPLDAALNLIARGWNPVPVEYRPKKPALGEGWQNVIITAATAACIAGADPEKSQKMPYLAKGGLKNQVIIPKHSRNPYDIGVRLLGVEVVEVGTPEQLQAAMGPQTAMGMWRETDIEALKPSSKPRNKLSRHQSTT